MTDSRPDPDTPDQTRALALALAYAPGDAAPRIIAKGRGLIAEEIIRRAQENGVFVHESPELVTLLMQSNLDDHIPPQLYVVVAELLAWIYHLEQQDASIATAMPPIVPPSPNRAPL